MADKEKMESSPIEETDVQTDEAPGEEEEAEPSLTEVLVEQFETALEKEGKKAFGRWGFGLFHSINPEAAEDTKSALGLKPRDAYDHYNIGCRLAAKKKYADAAKSFAEAIELNPELREAHFNRALALENGGQIAPAKTVWADYLTLCQEPDEATEIKQHLTELANR